MSIKKYNPAPSEASAGIGRESEATRLASKQS